MKITTRLLLFFSIVSSVIILLLLLNFYFARKEELKYIEKEKEKLHHTAAVSIEIIADFVKTSCDDYASWDAIADFIQTADTHFAYEYMSSMHDLYIEYIWVYDLNYLQIYNGNKANYPEIAHPMEENFVYKIFDTIAYSQKRATNYFLAKDSTLNIIYSSTIHPTGDIARATRPFGFLFMGKTLDTAFVKKLELLTDAKINIVFDTLYRSSGSENVISTTLDLFDYNNEFVASLILEREDFYLSESKINRRQMMMITLISTVLTLLTAILGLNRIVAKPLRNIIKSLDRNDLGFINKLVHRKNEFGKISKLLESFFKQKTMLEDSFNELWQKNISISEMNEELSQQKEEIETQRDRIEQTNDSLLDALKTINYKNQKITDSIQNAQRIQQTILPTRDFIESIFAESFVLFLPKDIVSGDFYWFYKQNDIVHFAAIDCTGHGVPGAFMSIFAYNILCKAMDEKHLKEPGEILDFISFSIRSTLRREQAYHHVNDGMDIALCSLDLKNRILKFAGVHNSLYIVQNGVLTEHKSNKQPIGEPFEDGAQCYEQHIITLPENAQLYLFSDGYYDQFGGKDMKKFMTKNFRELLLAIHQYPAQQQLEILKKTFETWKGNGEQIDDVLVIGIGF